MEKMVYQEIKEAPEVRVFLDQLDSPVLGTITEDDFKVQHKLISISGALQV